jgi:hypothetical protein
MKHVILAAFMLAPTAANASTGPDIPSVATQLRCTWLTLQQAVRGDFSQWVLPDFVPGRHLRAGELPECLRADDPVRPPSPDPQAQLAPTEDRP